MNRRNFIVSSVMGAGAISMFPSSALASTNGISLSRIGKGFDRLLHAVEYVSASHLTGSVANAHQRLMTTLQNEGYTYNAARVIKFNSSCYAVPLHKKPILGFASNELALIVKHNGVSKFYILNEKLAAEFAGLIENFSQNSASHELNLDAASFVFPTRVVQQTQGRETLFVYQNKLNNTITLKQQRKTASVVVS